MKRFFIFAAMLLTMTVNAVNLSDNPPFIFPGDPEKLVLVPQDFYDIDRSIVLCEYVCNYNIGMVSISCYGTGRSTTLSIVDEYGNIYDQTTIDTDFDNYAILNLPQGAGYYKITLNSELYYGESTIRIE